MSDTGLLHVLLIEDDNSDAWLLQSKLNEVNKGQHNLARAINVEQAIITLHKGTFDIALLDMSLPGFSGMDALSQLQNAAPALPVIILTSLNDEKLALQAVQQGAQDYLIKGQGDGHLIKRAIRYAIERKNSMANLIRLANYDALTGLINRPFFENRLELALARMRRSRLLVGVLFMDLHGFKQVNDSLGHAAGDRVLKETGSRLGAAFRDYDTVARFGGDEFAVLLDGVTRAEDCAIAAQKVIDALAVPVETEGGKVLVHAGIGIATTSGRERLPPALLIKHADTAMYRTKECRNSTYLFYDKSMLLHVKASA